MLESCLTLDQWLNQWLKFNKELISVVRKPVSANNGLVFLYPLVDVKIKKLRLMLSISVGCGSKTKDFLTRERNSKESVNEQLSMIVVGLVQSPYNS